MNFVSNYAAYLRKLEVALKAHELVVDPRNIRFSDEVLAAAKTGDWGGAAGELCKLLQETLLGKLSPSHQFLDQPYVRLVELPGYGKISIAILNNQSRDWYSTFETVGTFDFLVEAQRGVFQDCKTFLDLGGHHLVWTCFYALRSPDATVLAYEPSILNVSIGLFNCFINGVIEQVDVIPFAVLASNEHVAEDDDTGMLVDFMTVPIRTSCIDDLAAAKFDFIKTDIEGYEFKLLNDPVYLDLVRRAKSTHLELHLGHLVGQGILLQQWVDRLRAAKLRGTELYSQVDMFDFLDNCDHKGFYSFLIRNS